MEKKMVRKLVLSFIFAVLMMVISGCFEQQNGCGCKKEMSRAARIHKEALTVDSHVDIPSSVVSKYATEAMDMSKDQPNLQCDLYKMKKGGLDVVFLAAFNRQNERNEKTYKKAWQEAGDRLDAIDRLVAAYPDDCGLARSVDSVEQIVASGKIAIVACVENGFAIGKDLSKLQVLYDRGVRYITLSHIGHNDICDSSMPKAEIGDDGFEHKGLSAFGEKVVAEMNRLGIMCDVSHISDDAFYDVLRLSKAPVITSHSGCYSITPHVRNLKDHMLKALAKNGGVVQVVNLDSYIKLDSSERLAAIAEMEESTGYKQEKDSVVKKMDKKQKKAYDKLMAARGESMKLIDEKYPTRPTDIKAFVDHIDHAVKVIGIDHVGIGSDFDGGGGVPGFKDHSECMNVTKELIARGYSDEDIKKIWGGNILRVWRDIEKASERIQR